MLMVHLNIISKVKSKLLCHLLLAIGLSLSVNILLFNKCKRRQRVKIKARCFKLRNSQTAFLLPQMRP